MPRLGAAHRRPARGSVRSGRDRLVQLDRIAAGETDIDPLRTSYAYDQANRLTAMVHDVAETRRSGHCHW